MINRDGTKKIIKISSIILIVLIIVGYALFESHSLIKGPEIIIIDPVPGSLISTSSVTIIGKALRIQDISLNGRPILIDQEGNFSETLLLSPGYNISLFYAKDKFNRTI
ncbi:MAG: hypothetical protein WCJ39_10905, partial [bacterium]